MGTCQSHTAIHELTEMLEMIILNGRMTAASIRVDENRRRTIKNAFVLRPAIQMDYRSDARHLIQAFLQEQATRVELMLARAMAHCPGYKDDFLRLGGCDRHESAQRRGRRR